MKPDPLDSQSGPARRQTRVAIKGVPAILRYLGELRIGLDTALTVDEHREFAGDVTVRTADATIVLGATAAAAVWVVTA